MKEITISKEVLFNLIDSVKQGIVSETDFYNFFIKVYNCVCCGSDSNKYSSNVQLLYNSYKNSLLTVDNTLDKEKQREKFLEYSTQIRNTLKDKGLIPIVKNGMSKEKYDSIIQMFDWIPTDTVEQVLAWIRDKYDPEYYL